MATLNMSGISHEREILVLNDCVADLRTGNGISKIHFRCAGTLAPNPPEYLFSHSSNSVSSELSLATPSTSKFDVPKEFQDESRSSCSYFIDSG